MTEKSQKSDVAGEASGLPVEFSPPADSRRPPEGGEAAGKRGDYWSIVWKQFKKNRVAVVGLWLILAIFTEAVFVPFLANKYPYYWYTPETGLTFPLLKGLTNVDWLLLVGFALVLLVPVTRRILRRYGWQFWSLHELRRAAAVNAAVLLAAWVLLACFHHTTGRVLERETVTVNGQPQTIYLERDYRRELAEGSPARCLFPPIRYAATDLHAGPRYGPPSAEHPFGTDSLGRSIAACVLYGTRVGVAVGFISVGISVLIGVLIGGISAYFGGWVDLVLQRVVEMVMCFPTLFLILAIVAYWGPRLEVIMAAIGFTSWTGTSRLVRANVLQIKTLDYITSARAQGLRSLYIIVRHALPNAMTPVLVSATFGIAGAITTESTLSFLGMGDPDYPSWGQLLMDSREVATLSPVHLLVPGIAICLAVLAYNLAGEGVRDAIDPKLKV